MPHATPQLYQYSHVPETKENLDWADRKTISHGEKKEERVCVCAREERREEDDDDEEEGK